MRITRSGRQLTRSTGSGAAGFPSSKCVAAVEARCPPGGKSDDSDAFRIDVPITRARSHQADRALHVFHLNGMMIFGPDPVLENECIDAEGVEPSGNRRSFTWGQMLIGPAGTNDERARRLVGPGRETASGSGCPRPRTLVRPARPDPTSAGAVAMAPSWVRSRQWRLQFARPSILRARAIIIGPRSLMHSEATIVSAGE